MANTGANNQPDDEMQSARKRLAFIARAMPLANEVIASTNTQDHSSALQMSMDALYETDNVLNRIRGNSRL